LPPLLAAVVAMGMVEVRVVELEATVWLAVSLTLY
jgi:hypothetical protein